MSDFQLSIQRIRSSLDLEHHCGVENQEGESASLTKRAHFTDKRKSSAEEACDIITDINDRALFNDHLSAAVLFYSSLCSKHRTAFHEIELKTSVRMFKLNSQELRNELNVLYNSTEFGNASGALALLNCSYENLLELLPETVKLLQIIIATIPMITGETERCFSTLKRIKTFTRNTMKGGRLCALAMCSMEKQLLTSPNLSDLVINHLATQREESSLHLPNYKLKDCVKHVTMQRCHIAQWHDGFREGRDAVQDNFRTGRPRVEDNTVQLLASLLDADRRWTARSSRPNKVRPTQSAVKMMFIVAYDIDGVILHHAVPPRQTANADYYSRFLQHHLRPPLRSHTAAAVKDLLRRWQWEILVHPPYSPDMSSMRLRSFHQSERTTARDLVQYQR
ncbi:hypothetical protein ANN_10972 [Periplaneta americana]|uniref:HAT C-terminal dimerisation domain-containing protein n=1 Tax=Periplaneta americana TaxID=6978 RepID=A0ABQ8T5E8_PERAM|nr:hypothetical protein ANN_10972 [Periplaneta americana]